MKFHATINVQFDSGRHSIEHVAGGSFAVLAYRALRIAVANRRSRGELPTALVFQRIERERKGQPILEEVSRAE